MEKTVTLCFFSPFLISQHISPFRSARHATPRQASLCRIRPPQPADSRNMKSPYNQPCDDIILFIFAVSIFNNKKNYVQN